MDNLTYTVVKIMLIVFLICQTLAQPSIAGSAKARDLSLRDAVMLALRFNPQIKNAEINRVIQKYNLRVAQHAFEVNYALKSGTSFTRKQSGSNVTHGRSYSVDPSATYKTPWGTGITLGTSHSHDHEDFKHTATLSITQPLLKGAGTDIVQNSLFNAYDTAEIDKLNFKQTIIKQVTEVIDGYRDLIKNNNDNQTTEQSIKDTKRNISINRAKIKAGKLAPNVNLQSESQLESLKLQYEQSQNRTSVTRQGYLEKIGLDPDIKIKVPNTVHVEKIKIPDMEKSVDVALKDNLGYQIELIRFRERKRSLNVAKNNMLWDLNLSAGTSTSTAPANSGFSNDFKSFFTGKHSSQNVGLDLIVPIDNLGLKKDLASAKISLKNAEIDLAKVKRDLITDVKQQIINIESTVKQIASSRRSVELAQKSYNNERKKQELGRSSSIDVSTSQNSLISAKKSLIDSKIAYLKAITAYHQLLGSTLKEWGIELHY